jgi:hypothetical protein
MQVRGVTRGENGRPRYRAPACKGRADIDLHFDGKFLVLHPRQTRGMQEFAQPAGIDNSLPHDPSSHPDYFGNRNVNCSRAPQPSGPASGDSA